MKINDFDIKHILRVSYDCLELAFRRRTHYIYLEKSLKFFNIYLTKKIADDFLKSSAKFSRKQTIDDWVDCRVAVSQPGVICQLPPH